MFGGWLVIDSLHQFFISHIDRTLLTLYMPVVSTNKLTSLHCKPRHILLLGLMIVTVLEHTGGSTELSN